MDNRRSTTSSTISGRLRRFSQSFEESELPGGFSAATGRMASTILSRQAVPRRMSESIASTSTEAQPETQPAALCSSAFAPTPCEFVPEENRTEIEQEESPGSQTITQPEGEPPCATAFPNGYHFPPKHSFGESMKLGSIAFWNYCLTPLGFFVVLYGLNVVAWGGMLFLLLIEAGK